MKNALTLLLTLLIVSFSGPSHGQETHRTGHGDTIDAHSSAVPAPSEDKAYSEFMHRLNGVFVLLLAVLAILEHRLPAARSLRWGWPLLFLSSGIYLAIYSDRDSWPISDKGFIESLQDPMVFQHKVSALILLLLGVSEFCLRTGWGRAPLEWVFPSLAISAGVLLFAHGHTEQQSQSVHIRHLFLGGTAISIGVTKFFSGKYKAIERAWLFLILLLGLELLFYRE
jgi:putative copper resistance protein D